MGTYLHTALITSFSFSIPTTKPKGISSEEFKDLIIKTVVGSPESFICEENERDYCEYTLKREARRTYLVPLLSRYYADFYGKDSKDLLAYCKPVLDFLNTDPSDEELDNWAEEEGFGSFFVTADWLRIANINGLQIKVNVSYLMLTSEGKVIVEELEKHLAFFENALRSTYSDNPLGKCLTVDLG